MLKKKKHSPKKLYNALVFEYINTVFRDLEKPERKRIICLINLNGITKSELDVKPQKNKHELK